MADNNARPEGQPPHEGIGGERVKESDSSSNRTSQGSSGIVESQGNTATGVQVASSIPQKVYMTVANGINSYQDEQGNPMIPVYDTGSASNTPIYYQAAVPEQSVRIEPPPKKKVEKENIEAGKRDAPSNMQASFQSGQNQSFSDAHKDHAEERRNRDNNVRQGSNGDYSGRKAALLPDSYYQDIWAAERGKFIL